MMPPVDPKSPLDSFMSRYWQDAEAGRVLGLGEYLRIFPGDERGIADEYFALIGSSSPDGGRRSSTTDPDRIGPYRLIEEIGRGGQGVVWLAEDTELHRNVARPR